MRKQLSRSLVAVAASVFLVLALLPIGAAATTLPNSCGSVAASQPGGRNITTTSNVTCSTALSVAGGWEKTCPYSGACSTDARTIQLFTCTGIPGTNFSVDVKCFRDSRTKKIFFTWTPAMGASASGQVVSINQNLKESLPTPYDNVLGSGYPDLKYHPELVNFAKRIIKILPKAPDVVIMQEVLQSSEDVTASDLTNAIGYHYISLVEPGPENLNDIVNADHTEMIKWNTGLIINAQTMDPTGNQGYKTFKQTWEEAVDHCPTSTPPHPPCIQGEKLAWGEVVEKASGIHVAMFDIHFLPNHKFSTTDLGNAARTRWSRKIVTFVNDKMPTATIKLIAGEFDQNRCFGGSPELPDCREKPFYKAYTNGGYIDGVVQENPDPAALEAATGQRIDFAFTHGTVVKDRRDMAYTIMDQKHGGNPDYISDHRMEWWKATP